MTNKTDADQIGFCLTRAVREILTDIAERIRQIACNMLKKGSRMLCCAMALFLAACGGNIISNSGVYYNRGLEDSYNSILLINIVRSAKGRPTYFSAVGDYSGSTDNSLGLSTDLDASINELSSTDVGLGIDAGPDQSRNANVSSLETEQFTQAILTPLSRKLFFLLAEGQARDRLDLLTTLTVKWIAVPSSTIASLQRQATSECTGNTATFPKALKAMCQQLPVVIANGNCAGSLTSGSGRIVVRSDPTNACQHARFRALVEPITILQPALLRSNSGNSVTLLALEQSAASPISAREVRSGAAATASNDADKPKAPPSRNQDLLLFGSGSSFALRSPKEIIQYLGEIVKADYLDETVPMLTGPRGSEIPVFELLHGDRITSDAKLYEIDGEPYALDEPDLGKHASSFSYPSLAVLKEVISLNTSQSVLPKSPNILVQ
ncbi:hypothetical protein [Ruegeria sp.]|uniref:hypothetical protein n=1 Tax=Ruegeria sp. TaxID=1879320 RepID=UPI003C7E0519